MIILNSQLQNHLLNETGGGSRVDEEEEVESSLCKNDGDYEKSKARGEHLHVVAGGAGAGAGAAVDQVNFSKNGNSRRALIQQLENSNCNKVTFSPSTNTKEDEEKNMDPSSTFEPSFVRNNHLMNAVYNIFHYCIIWSMVGYSIALFQMMTDQSNSTTTRFTSIGSSSISSSRENVHQLILFFVLIIVGGTISISIYILILYIAKKNKQRNMTEYIKCRKEIQGLLGSTGAPSLQIQSTAVQLQSLMKMNTSCSSLWNGLIYLKHNIHLNQEWNQTMMNFTKQHVQYLSKIDTCIQMIRIATSIQLGLGPSSLSIDRVDKQYIHHHKNANNSKGLQRQHHVNVPPNLKHIREMIYTSLIKEMHSIHFIYEKVYKMYRMGYDDEVDHVKKSLDESLLLFISSSSSSSSSSSPSNVLTISLLKKLRAYVARLLSETLSILLDLYSTNINQTIQTFNITDEQQKIINCLASSTIVTEELERYIVALLPCSSRREERETRAGSIDEDNDHDDPTKKRNTNTASLFSKQIPHLEVRINGLHCTNWAFQHSIKHQMEIINNGHTTGGSVEEWSEETKLLWNRIGDEIETILHLYQTVDNAMHHCYSNDNDGDDSSSGGEKVKEMKDCKVQNVMDKNEYDDEGLLESYLEHKDESDRSKKDKILVFSGKGVKSSRQSIKRKKEGTKNNDQNHRPFNSSELLPPSFLAEPSARSMLLNELQNRLETLEKVEEWDAIENQSCEQSKEKNVCMTMKSRTSTANNNETRSQVSFLGVQGSLLSELQDALSKSNDCENYAT